MPSGYYNRPLLAGTYDFQYNAYGYASLDVDNIAVENYQTTPLNIGLGEGVSGDIVSVSIDKDGKGTVSPYVGTELFNQGANVFLEAAADEHWEFEQWVINGEDYQESSITYALEENTDIVAHFVTSLTLVLSADSINFGGALPGDTLDEQLTISNYGNMPLTIEDVDTGCGHFDFTGDFPDTLDPEQEKTYTVSFLPQSTGDFETVAVIFSDAANNPEAELYLAGTGLDPTYVTRPDGHVANLEVYPNPLSAQSIVTLEIDSRQHVTMAIHNLQGQRVDMLFEGLLDAGQQRFGLGDLYEQLNPGFYILSVRSESTRKAVRMLLTD